MIPQKFKKLVNMTTHLKSRNASWNLDNSKNKNIYFSNPVATLLEDKDGKSFVIRKGKKTHLRGTLLANIDKQLKKGFYACGYFSYEFNQEINKPFKYRAIFNIYKGLSFNPPKLPIVYEKKLVLRKRTSDTTFLAGVKKAKQYIKNGDIYQINLSREFEFDKVKNPYNLFLKYYKAQPVEYGAFFDFHDHALVSGSMELFLRKNGNLITTRPIKGTARLGSKDDKNLKKNLKETSENLMIVDLMRNDLSQICTTGSVKTEKLFRKKSYTTLVQLESEIQGNLKSQVKNEEIFTRLMPPGSVTGTPKSRAKKIINEIEKHTRGPYCGALGYFGPSGDFCFSVGIRLALIEKNSSKFYTGAGIVWDSKASKENTETILKSKAFKQSIKVK